MSHVGEMLAALAPGTPNLEPGVSQSRRKLPLSAELAAAIAAVQPRGAQLIAWAKYAGDAASFGPLRNELLIEAAKHPELMPLAKKRQITPIIEAALSEWLAPPACAPCHGRGTTFARDGDALVRVLCVDCDGTGRTVLAESARAEQSGIAWGTWREMGGLRGDTYAMILDTLAEWEARLLRGVRHQITSGGAAHGLEIVG